jgi:hypothetical protein
VDGGKGAEKEAGEVAEDGSSAGWDGVGSQENVEVPQGIVDSLSVLEVASAMEELQGEVIGPVRLRLHMARTQHGSRIKNPVAAFSTGGREVEATMVAGNWFSGCGLHFLSLRWGGGYPTPGVFDERFQKVLKTKERVRKKWLRVRNVMKTGDLEIGGWRSELELRDNPETAAVGGGRQVDVVRRRSWPILLFRYSNY